MLSVSNKYGFVNQSEQFEDRIVASENKSNYKIIKKGYFAYNPARINVGSIALLNNYEIGIVSPMYVCFKAVNGLNPDYLYYFLQSRRFFYELNRRLEGSVRQCLTFENMKDIEIPLISDSEQVNIAHTLSDLTKVVCREEKLLELLKKQKTYLLSKMFI